MYLLKLITRNALRHKLRTLGLAVDRVVTGLPPGENDKE